MLFRLNLYKNFSGPPPLYRVTKTPSFSNNFLSRALDFNALVIFLGGFRYCGIFARHIEVTSAESYEISCVLVVEIYTVNTVGEPEIHASLDA